MRGGESGFSLPSKQMIKVILTSFKYYTCFSEWQHSNATEFNANFIRDNPANITNLEGKLILIQNHLKGAQLSP